MALLVYHLQQNYYQQNKDVLPDGLLLLLLEDVPLKKQPIEKLLHKAHQQVGIKFLSFTMEDERIREETDTSINEG